MSIELNGIGDFLLMLFKKSTISQGLLPFVYARNRTRKKKNEHSHRNRLQMHIIDLVRRSSSQDGVLLCPIKFDPSFSKGNTALYKKSKSIKIFSMTIPIDLNSGIKQAKQNVRLSDGLSKSEKKAEENVMVSFSDIYSLCVCV
ncbi:unnamed protein product [Orchesella dallaii]|uniref:Uncharacterized protein n=1 Tax=Orchesella dallaii TaxID=48710 RepID=A0ABP1RKZ2_9HEXA